ncbi:tetratricopeptide repeat protein [Singulisphaera sp. PoT]|uniref:tetratricopeptide repeat protein n=1 Tax=Singulisphaera sp. PoT TaxID=3411797 RepID=UPI003BF50DC7
MAEAREHESLTEARRRVTQRRQAVGERHPDYATSLNQLALLLLMHGEPEEAEGLLRESLSVRLDALGERHPDYATNLSSLGGLLWARGDLDAAEPMLRQALRIREEVLGEGHSKTVASRQSLGQLVFARQERDKVNLATTRPVDPAHPPLAMPARPTPVPAPEPVFEALVSRPAPVASARPPQKARPAAPVAPAVVEATRPASISSAHDRASLVIRIKTLSTDFSRVSDRLANEVERWKAGGVPPSEALILDLNTCGREFAALREETLRLAERVGLPTRGKSLGSLREIESLFREIGEAESRREQINAVRDRALGILDRVLSLRHPDLAEFPPLEGCKTGAKDLRDRIASADPLDLPEEATQLAEGDHPFYRLLALVDGTESLSDDLWASSLEMVENVFGKPLSVAVARAKVVMPS